MACVVSTNMVDKDLQHHVNGKPQKVKNLTWGANMVREFHTECNHMRLQDDVDMRSEDARDGMEVYKDTSPPTPKQPVPKREVKTKPCESNKKQEAQYIPKVKAEEIKSEEIKAEKVFRKQK
jgi:hypothetical protein